MLGVARGRLQERPLQFEHGNVRVKSWQPMSNSWSASSQPEFVDAVLGGEGRARFCTQSCSKAGQRLVNPSPTPHPMGGCKGLPCNSPLPREDLYGPYPQYGWDFLEEIPVKFRKDPGNALRAFPGIPLVAL